MVELVWQNLEDNLYRAKIIGGWLVSTMDGGHFTSITFVTDPKFNWNDESDAIIAQLELADPGILEKKITRCRSQHSTYDIYVEEHSNIIVVPATAVKRQPKEGMTLKQILTVKEADKDENSN